MAGTPYIRNIEHLQTMAKEAMVMLVKSIEAYVEKDLEKAEKVIESDDIIDDLFDQIKAELIDAIHQNPDNGEDRRSCNKYCGMGNLLYHRKPSGLGK